MNNALRVAYELHKKNKLKKMSDGGLVENQKEGYLDENDKHSSKEKLDAKVDFADNENEDEENENESMVERIARKMRTRKLNDR